VNWGEEGRPLRAQRTDMNLDAIRSNVKNLCVGRAAPHEPLAVGQLP
jgi:hypothetical protein